MPICPACGSVIKSLLSVETIKSYVYVTIDDDYKEIIYGDEIDRVSQDPFGSYFECPECQEEMASSEKDAITFLLGNGD
jgi:predicted RNA-binding Zn-ribbon protein involved in translation (DUF1610 family)